MSRLVVFGCSFTYGHGLPDCFIPPLNAGEKPSQMGWPHIVSKKLNRECLNLSKCGIGNYEILMKILDTKFRPSDMVIIGFTFFDRFDMYKLVDQSGASHRINYHTTEHKNLLLEMSNEEYHIKNYWNNWLSMHHAISYLNSLKIKNYSFHNLKPCHKENQEKPKLLDIKNYWDDMNLIQVDGCLDDPKINKEQKGEGHPGLESNKLQADLIYNKIIADITDYNK